MKREGNDILNAYCQGQGCIVYVWMRSFRKHFIRIGLKKSYLNAIFLTLNKSYKNL